MNTIQVQADKIAIYLKLERQLCHKCKKELDRLNEKQKKIHTTPRLSNK